MFPYQCNQYSTSATIKDVFKQADIVQSQHNDKSKFVSVVVLEEVGLAEDSPDLPLKVLHPLLEDGTQGSNSGYSIEVITSVAYLCIFLLHSYVYQGWSGQWCKLIDSLVNCLQKD